MYNKEAYVLVLVHETSTIFPKVVTTQYAAKKNFTSIELEWSSMVKGTHVYQTRDS